jgi:hypothetical protein
MGNRFALIVMVISVIILIGLAIYSYKLKLEKYFGKKKKKTSFKINFLYGASYIFKNTPILKKRYARIRHKVSITYPAENVSVEFLTTRTLLSQYVLALGGIFIVLFLAQGDLFFIMSGLVAIYLLLEEATTSATDKLDFKLLKQMREFVTNIISNYNKLQTDPADAVKLTLDNNPPEIGAHAESIYKALTSVNIRSESDKYTDKAPNNFLMLFMAICQTIQEYGDKKIDGQSMFIKNNIYLNEEVSNEINYYKRNNSRFKSLGFIILVPMLIIKPLEMWSVHEFPELASYYKSIYGTIIMTLEVATILFLYMVVQSLKSKKAMQLKERSIFTKLAAMPFLNRILKAYNRKHYTKSIRINDDLLTVKDRTGVNAFYVKKWVFAIGGFVIMNIVLTSAIIRARVTAFEDFAKDYESAFVLSESYVEQMDDFSKQIAEMYKDIDYEQLSEGEISERLVQEYGIRSEYVDTMAKTIVSRIEAYQNTYYKWFYLIVSMLFAVLLFKIPDILLAVQIKQAKKEEVEEITKMQTVSLILMHVTGMNLEQILVWLEKFSYCFRYRIEQCLIDLPHGETKAIQKMQEDPSVLFKSYCDNLLNIDNVGVERAFSTIEGDRSYYSDMRQQEQDERSKSNASISSILAFIPIMLVLFGQLVFPIVKMALTMQDSLRQAMGGM